MKFAGRISKFEVGDTVLYNNIEGIVTSIGILGGKLSGFEFLYEVKLDNGETIKVIDKALEKKKIMGKTSKEIAARKRLARETEKVEEPKVSNLEYNQMICDLLRFVVENEKDMSFVEILREYIMPKSLDEFMNFMFEDSEATYNRLKENS